MNEIETALSPADFELGGVTDVWSCGSDGSGSRRLADALVRLGNELS